MKIKVINPNTFVLMTEGIAESARRAARPETEIITVNPQKGPISIECFYDGHLAFVGVIEEVKKSLKEEEIDAYILACYGDPGLEALRELTDKPVIGIAEASMFTACFLAPKFSIITVIPRVIVPLEQLVKKYGIYERLASIRSTRLSVVEFASDLEAGKEALAVEGKLAVEQDGAEALLLGCSGMAGFDEELEEKLGVPVIDGVTAALKIAEGLVDLKKKTSKINTYAKPDQKLIEGFDPIFNIE